MCFLSIADWKIATWVLICLYVPVTIGFLVLCLLIRRKVSESFLITSDDNRYNRSIICFSEIRKKQAYIGCQSKFDPFQRNSRRYASLMNFDRRLTCTFDSFIVTCISSSHLVVLFHPFTILSFSVTKIKFDHFILHLCTFIHLCSKF